MVDGPLLKESTKKLERLWLINPVVDGRVTIHWVAGCMVTILTTCHPQGRPSHFGGISSALVRFRWRPSSSVEVLAFTFQRRRSLDRIPLDADGCVPGGVPRTFAARGTSAVSPRRNRRWRPKVGWDSRAEWNGDVVVVFVGIWCRHFHFNFDVDRRWTTNNYSAIEIYRDYDSNKPCITA